MKAKVSVPQDILPAFCQKHGIRWLAIFGSALHEDFRPDSDIDILVEFYPNRIPTLLGMARMERKLGEIFDGRKVDSRTPEDLSRYFRQQVLAEAEVQYVAG